MRFSFDLMDPVRGRLVTVHCRMDRRAACGAEVLRYEDAETGQTLRYEWPVYETSHALVSRADRWLWENVDRNTLTVKKRRHTLA